LCRAAQSRAGAATATRGAARSGAAPLGLGYWVQAASHDARGRVDARPPAARQVDQWVAEVREKAPALTVAKYHGAQRRKLLPPLALDAHDVVVTTYAVLVMDGREQALLRQRHADGPAPRGPEPSAGVFAVPWHRRAPRAARTTLLPCAPRAGCSVGAARCQLRRPRLLLPRASPLALRRACACACLCTSRARCGRPSALLRLRVGALSVPGTAPALRESLRAAGLHQRAAVTRAGPSWTRRTPSGTIARRRVGPALGRLICVGLGQG